MAHRKSFLHASFIMMKSTVRQIVSQIFSLRFVLPAAFVVGLISGCVHRLPIEEYTMARAAYEAAKDADSARFAPSLWFSAEQAYREGQKAFRDRRYSDAKTAFAKAQDLSEQAENSARLTKDQSGEVIP